MTTTTTPSTMPAFDAESVAMLSGPRLRRAIAAVLRAEPRMAAHPAVQQARAATKDWLAPHEHDDQDQDMARPPPTTSSSGSTTTAAAATATTADAAGAYLAAMSACLVHEAFVWPILQHLRPFAMDLLARLLDPALAIFEPAPAKTTPRAFVRCDDNLLRRERIAEALVTLLAFLPQAAPMVLQYFAESPCFFDFVTVAATQREQHTQPAVRERLRRIVRTAHRLLSLPDPRAVAALWNWAGFYPLCFHDDLGVRWHAARATAIVLRMSNARRNAFLNELEVGDGRRHATIQELELDELRFARRRAQQRVELATSQPQTRSGDSDDDLAAHQPIPFHSSLTNVFGVLVPSSTARRQRADENAEDSSEPLVTTPSTKRNLQSLAIALGLQRPILIAGPGGCGKTAIIRELARLAGNHSMVELHLDDQIDSKTLLGSYVCTDIPGEFTWQPGALTTAVLEGRWVVVEDIDRAPFEVLAALMPLLETREMELPGRGELLVAHANFQIFATTSHGNVMPKGFQESTWSRVDVEPLVDDEMAQILRALFPRIPKAVLQRIMTTFNVVSGKSVTSDVAPLTSRSGVWSETRRNYGRDFSLRDLLKWCRRICAFCFTGYGAVAAAHDDEDVYVTEDERLRVVVEACDVFCSGIRVPETRLAAAIAIGEIWQLPEDRISYLLEQHRPSVKFHAHEVELGRVHLPTLSNNQDVDVAKSSSFVMTGHVLRLLEKLAAIVYTCEPALLVGETGCGKTTVIQHLAASMGQKLVVQNLNIQSDSADLVGGFKPVELHLIARPLYMSFVDLFNATFTSKRNAGFLNVVRMAFEHKDWKKMSKGMNKAVAMANSKFEQESGGTEESKTRAKGASPAALRARWENFNGDLGRFERQRDHVESHFAFAFVEGVLVTALREGHWVLLDEINLASSETLERISTLLEPDHGRCAFSLTERGDVEVLRPHPNFRLFGAMNPSTDVGKKDLPPALRHRFTEIYVDECVSPTDLQLVVQHHFREIPSSPVTETVSFYLAARGHAEDRLSDGARHKPRYSLRTLSQALQITRILIQRGYGLERALYEGFTSTFCTVLDRESRLFLEKVIKNTFAKKLKARDLDRAPPRPKGKVVEAPHEFVLVSSYWVRQGGHMDPRDDAVADPVTNQKRFVLTKSVEENLRHVARAALIGKYPVLLQGPTSAGKTSLITYLAARLGQKCVRINNHEHTDIQEYLGSYVSDSNGKLTFKEGVLVEAVRQGWWIILDELNLAPSEVLEALNRLLDDNRELFLPETQETVRPHPKFMLFATQNPPGLYGGRKVLSRAFRNRFLEIQVDEAPTSELQTILQERSSLPPSYCAILIDVMRQLQLVRQQSSIFAGKSGFITTRDLLRWAERRPSTKQALAEEGYCLLAERLRKDDEKMVVQRVLEQSCKVKIDLDAMYYRGEARESSLLNADGEIEQEVVWGSNEQFERVQEMIEQALTKEDLAGNAAGLDKISVTKALRRLFALVGRCLQHQEPVLLVGETGCGKTTVCQLYSLLFNQPLHIINCHQHTETSDFLGCLRPVRGKEMIAEDLKSAIVECLVAAGANNDEIASKPISDLLEMYEREKSRLLTTNSTDEDQGSEVLERVEHLKRRYQSIFEWCDGPLVESMKKGDLILVDEVNLAEDAVLERLNSVLEPSRTLLLAEKGGDHVEEITANSKWRIFATMNPGGDFGKRELSPALRNRFTEIWVPSISDLEDIATIITDRLVGRSKLAHAPLTHLCDPILAFVKHFNAKNGGIGGVGAVTLRDILSWINFICSVMKSRDEGGSAVSAWTAFVQGAALSILDGLGLGSDKSLHSALQARDEAYQYLLSLVPGDDSEAKDEVLASLHATTQAIDDKIAGLNNADQTCFGIGPFLIARGPDPVLRAPSFSLKAPTTMSNLYRVLRAMQVNRPIILEGSPGVGKTSLISALAAASGHRLVRINLSEQTDISDLFGSDLPAASDSTSNDDADASKGSPSGMFEWCDGVFLRALKAGDWVLLDELNLASQSVLEGLNSCLDHRGTVYIPELDREFECPPSFRVFAAQNPLRQGGGRKGLPKSFLNRFTRVFVETLDSEDLVHIATSIYPSLKQVPVQACGTLSEENVLERMIAFNSAIHADTMTTCAYGRLGAPWEFNLRDVFRLCELLRQHSHQCPPGIVGTPSVVERLRYYVNTIYVERMRSPRDRECVARRFEEFFAVTPTDTSNVSLRVVDSHVQVGRAFLRRRDDLLRVSRVTPPVFTFLLKPMEALIHCVNMNWPALLVGQSGSGKTSTVRLLAALSGNTLHELAMSAGTDATELLGCFEQVDLGRKLRNIRDQVSDVYDEVIQELLHQSALPGDAHANRRKVLIKHARAMSNVWWALSQHEKDVTENKGKQVMKGELDRVVVDHLNEILTGLLKAANLVTISEAHIAGVKRYQMLVREIVSLGSTSTPASAFEWVDGTLIHAMERGEWILLDNVNFCSSSVLDRLNSLMETGGELLINECGVINGQLRVIKPHPNFRLFLAMDPQFGEVSRAMRNRCVEIALLSDEVEPRDLVHMVMAAGIPGFEFARCLEVVHRHIASVCSSTIKFGQRLDRRHLEKWAILASREFDRGIPIVLAIERGFRRVYGDDLLRLADADIKWARSCFEKAVHQTQSTHSDFTVLDSSTTELCSKSEAVMIQRDIAYVEYLLRVATAEDACENDPLLNDWMINSTSSVGSSELELVESLEQQCRAGFSASSVHVVESTIQTVSQYLTTRSSFPDGGKSSSTLLSPFALRRYVQASLLASSPVITEDRLIAALDALIKSDDSAIQKSAMLLSRFLRSLLTHSTYVSCAKQIRSDLAALASCLSAEGEGTSALTIMLRSPIYMNMNAPLVGFVDDLIARKAVENEHAVALWKNIQSTQRRLECLSGSEWLRFCEQEQYQELDALLGSRNNATGGQATKRRKVPAFDGDLSSLSVLQQSYAVHEYHADRSTVANELVVLIYPLLKALDQWVQMWISSPAIPALTPTVGLLIRDRFEFSIQLRDKKFEWTHFLIHWQYVKKSMSALQNHVDGETVASLFGESWEAVLDMRQRIDDTIDKVMGCTRTTNTLWKSGGHALLPRSADLWNAKFLLERLSKTHMQLNSKNFAPATEMCSSPTASDRVDVLALLFGGVLSMEAAMKSGQLDVSSLFYIDAASRREVLHALCAFSYISKQQAKTATATEVSVSSAPNGQSYVRMAEELVTLPDVLLRKIQDHHSSITSLISSKTLYLSELEDTSANQHLLDFVNQDVDGRTGRDAPILLFDLKESAKLIEDLVKFQLAPLKEHWLARRELDVIPHLFHIINTTQLSSTLGSSPIGSEVLERVQKTLFELEALVDELIEVGLRSPASFQAYQDIVWCGHRFMGKDEDNNSTPTWDDLVEFVNVLKSHSSSILYGFHSFLRQNSFNNVDDIAMEIFDTQAKLRRRQTERARGRKLETDEESTSVVGGLPRVFQAVGTAVVLRAIAEVDLHNSKCATIETQVRMLRMQKIKEHLREHAVATDTALPAAVYNLIKQVFVVTISAFASTFQDVWQELREILSSISTSPKPALSEDERHRMLRLLRQSPDTSFAALVGDVLTPLTSLFVKCELSSLSMTMLGESLVLLGMWRFQLFVPSSPVDPVIKPLIKKEMLMNRVALLTLQTATDGAISRLFPQTIHCVSDSTVQDVARLACDVRKVSALAIQRFNAEQKVPVKPSVFGDLFRDLQRFHQTIMPLSKLTAFIKVIRNQAGTNKHRQLLRELEMFQQTTESFLMQMEMKYSDSFYDIVEPIASSIFAVKEGLGVLMWHIHTILQSQIVPENDKVDTALALLRFPRPIPASLSSSQTLEDEIIFNLVRMVGTKSSALVSGTGHGSNRKASDVALLHVALAKMALVFRESLSPVNNTVSADRKATVLRNSKAIFDLFLTKWQEQKAREEERKREEEQLFMYKTRHMEIETEDQLLEQEYRQQFPDFVGRDFEMFLSPEEQQLAQQRSEPNSPQPANGDVWINDELLAELCEVHRQLYASTPGSSPTISHKAVLEAFARAFGLAVNMRPTINALHAPSVEHAAIGSSLLAASIVQSRLRVGQVPATSALSSEYIRGVDFHRDPLVQEVVLVAQPLQNLLLKVQQLLKLWPDHAILQQVVLIADRIRNFEISSPLVRTLTAVELLVRKAQEWESYAARDYSIATELGALSSLITRWRKLELYSWPHLLHVKERQHRAAAQKTWFHMYSLLTASFEGDTTGQNADVEACVSKKEWQWLYLSEATQWVFKGAKSDTIVAHMTEEQRKWRSELFSTLDAYVRSCPMGQYESRLLMLYAFCGQLFLEYWHGKGTDAMSLNQSSAVFGLANVLYHLYRYYAQHLPYVDRQWNGLKSPIQRQLIEFVKICRWDEQTYYSLAESAEKSHRKLMKFVRDYDAVLTVNMQTVIDASTDSGISKEGGYVGLSTTKAELDRCGDAVFVPVLTTSNDEESTPTEDPSTDAKQVETSNAEGEDNANTKVIRLLHEPKALSESLPIAVVLSSYAEKLPHLTKRITKYTLKQILTPDRVRERQVPHELCEDLCSTVFYRLALFQHDGKSKEGQKLPKGAKKKALIDLLSELKTQGLSYHRMQLPAEQQNIEQLFALDVPDVENCIRVDGINDLVIQEDAHATTLSAKRKKTKKAKKSASADDTTALGRDGPAKNSPLWLWLRADAYYYRFISQLSSLRFSAMTQFSHDLSISEVDRINGYAENMLFRMLQQRQLLHAASLSHESLVMAMQRFDEFQAWRHEYMDQNKTRQTMRISIDWQQHQLDAITRVRGPLRDLEILVLQVLRTSSSSSADSMAIKEKFTRMFDSLRDVENALSTSADGKRRIQMSSGVPSIPYHESISSEESERSGAGGLAAFAHPQKRVYGVSPLVNSPDSVSSDSQLSAGTITIPLGTEILMRNRERLEDVRDCLAAVKDLFAHVAPTAPFDALFSELEKINTREQELAADVVNVTDEHDRSSKTSSEEANDSKQVFAHQYDKLVETILVAIQDLTKVEKVPDAGANDADNADVTLHAKLNELTMTLKNARIHPIAIQMSQLLKTMEDQYGRMLDSDDSYHAWLDALKDSFRLMKLLEPAVYDVRAISRQLLADFLVAHKSVTKLDFVLIRIFRNLFQHGFCRSADEKDDGEQGSGDGQKMKFEDDVDGTGMGEGEGKKDVSNEIEDEEQLLGLKGEQNEQKPPEAGEKPEDTGLEMQNDFDGAMHDVPEDEQNDDDDRNDDDEEELDREMGDFDQDDENVVDEKKWGDDSDDDEDQIDKENEKFEENSRMDGSEAIEDEIRGKDDDDSDKSKPKEDDKATSKEQQPKVEQEQGDDEDGAGGSDEEDGEEDEEKKDPVNDDFEDKYEEKHDNVDPNSREGEEDDEHGGEEGDELPENMQLDDGDDGDDNDAGVDDEPDSNVPDDVDGDGSDQEMDENEANKDAEDDADADEEKEDDDPLDNALQLGAGGLDEEMNAPDEEENPEPDTEEQQQQDEDASNQEKSSSAVAGTQSKDGVDEVEPDEGSNDDDEAKNDDAPQDQDDNKDPNEQRPQSSRMAQSQTTDDNQEWRPSDQVEQPPQVENDEQKRSRRKQEPNPYRNPRNAQEHWKRRVDMINREKGDDDDDTPQDRGDKTEKEMTAAELLDDDEEMEDAQHALAPAQENQFMNQQPPQDEEDKVDPTSKDDDQPSGNGAMAAMEEDDVDMEGDDADAKQERDEPPSDVREEPTAAPERDHAVDLEKDAATKDDHPTPPVEEPSAQEPADVDMDDARESGAVTIPQPGEDSRRKKDLGLDEDDKADDVDAPMPKLLTPEEIAGLRDELDTSIAQWGHDQATHGAQLWSKYTAITMGASQRLCEQLRLVLEPMLRAKLEGDFRTGKRINMRKVIPYIASQFRKDKIWMRRTRPSKRQYQIMVAIDDSESMADNHAGRLALEAMTTLCKAMAQLEVGEISVVKFGQDIQLLHAFDAPFTDDAGGRVITQFGFQQKKTNMITTLDAILQVLETAKQSASSAAANAAVEFTQIVFLISDGRFDTDGRTRIKKLIEKALEQQQLIVLLIVDHSEHQENSILETKSVTFTKGKVEMVPYLENYPFPYYVILPTSTLLPEILSDSLRQWFEMLQMKQ